MGIMLAFAVGWVMGSRGGRRGFEDVVDALQAVGESDEFHGLLDATKSHVGFALKEIASQLTGESEELPGVDDVLTRVRSMMGRAGGPTSSAS